MKNFTSQLKTIGFTSGLIALLFVWSNGASAQCSSTTASSSSPQTSGNTGTSMTWSQNASSYLDVTSVTNGGKYYISSSTSTDYFTIKTGSGGSSGTVITKGTSPITFTASATTIYIVLNTNSSCGTSTTSRTITWAAIPTITSITSSACTGSTFTVTGTALSGVTSISVNGTNAPTFTVSSSTSITVTIPAGASTGTVSVTGPGGTATSSASLTINPLPGDNSGANASICSGSNTVTGASSTTGHTYSWSPSTGLSSSTVSNPTASPTATTTYTLTETITSTGCSVSNTTVITVNPLPGDNSGANATICNGSSTVTGAASTTGHTYSWSPSTGLSSSTVSNPTANPTATTTYTLTETITATGCSVSNTTVITVNAAPGNNTGSAKSICSGTSTTIGASSTTGHTYSWSPSTGLSSSTVSNPTANPTATTTYTLTETITATGCSVANSVVVTVNPLPGDNSGANQAICNGTGVAIGASGATGHTYSWSPSTGLSSSTAANPTATPTVTTTYTLTETITATGCSESNTTVVTDNPLPTNITPTGTATICSGNSVNISIANSQSGVNYQLRNNSGNTNVGSSIAGTGGTITLPTGALTGTTIFNVLATNATTSCSLEMTGTVTITVNTSPGNDAGSSQSYCGSGSVTLGGSSTTGHTYSWSPSTGLSSAAVSNPTASPTTTTTYTLTETITSTGCSAVNSVVVTVNAIPTITISPNYCNGGGNVLLNASTATSYLWSNGGTNSSITVSTAGTYTVTVTNAAGCTASEADTVAVELVVNGDFSQGNTGFTTTYGYTTASDGLLPENLYAIGPDAHYYHPNFYGNAVDSGNNFMIINGGTQTPPLTVWQETVTVIPNTNYYFSAYAMSMDNVTPFAELQFNINGTQVGTTANLPTGVETTAGPFVWNRFYATWNSGSSTSALLTIVDLNTSANGNDYGLDDISCSTLSTVPLSAAPATNSPACVGSTFNITSNILGGMMPMTYSWTGPNNFTSTSVNDSITNVTSAAAGVYNLTVTDEHGCTVSASTSSATIDPVPGNNAGSAKTICSGSSATIGASSTTGHTYSWSPSTGLSSSTASNPTANPTSTTTYTLIETITATGCTSSNTIVVNVNPVPGNDAGSAASICNGTNATIGAASTTGHTYSWSPATTLNSSTTSNPTATPATTTTYTLTETITATGCTAANSVIVTVNAGPGNNAGSAKSICSGSSTTIGATSTTGHTYSWSPSTALSSSTVSNPTANPTATTTYTLTETITATGCSAVNSVVVTVNPLPANDAGAATAVCNGTSTSIGAASTTGHTYSWSPSTALSSATISNPTANPTATTTYTLTETITSTGCSAANSVVVSYGEAPTISATTPAGICSGSSASITASCSANCGSSMTYNWSPATGLSATTGATVTASPTATTTYTITGVNSSGCTSTSAVINTGTTITGSGLTSNNYLVGDQYTTSVPLTATQIVTYGTAGGSAQVALYSNASGNIPGAQLCATVTGTVTSNGWTTFNIASTYLPAGTYWIVFDINTTNGIVTTSSTGTRKFLAQTYGSLPATAPSSGWTTGAGPLDATYFVGNPVITSVVTVNPLPGNDAGTNATICNGASTSLGAASTAGNTYSWSPSTGLSSSVVSNPTANPTTTTTYTLTETITATGCSVANSVVVSVNPSVGNNAGSATSICNGGSATLGSASTTGHTYSWSPSTSLSSSTASNPTANPTTTTTYTLTETITATGCSAANSVVVTVNAPPANDTGSAKTICSGTSTTIGASSTAGHTYSWSPSTALSSSTSSNPTANPTATTTYTLTETITATGCSAANSVVVTVNPLPGNDAGSAATICSGTSATIGAASTTGHTYSWSPSTALSSSTVSNPSANPATSTTYTLTETITATGCSVANSVTITVNPSVTNNAGSNTSICNGNSTTLGATSTAGHTYSWSPSATLSSSTVSNPTANPTTTTTYTLTESITATGCAAINSVVVTINPLPGNDAGSAASICNGAGTSIGASSTTGHTYSWSPSTALSSSTVSNPTANPTTTSTYTLTETITATGCSASNSVVVTVNPLPGNDAGSAASICSGASTTLGASSTTGHTYNWSPSTALSSSAVSNPSASPTTTTTYTLTETITATGCSAANSVVVTVNALPANDAGSAKTICSGTSTTIGASSTTGHTYSWSPSTALSSSTISNPTANPTTTTTYTLTETITATGCSAASSVVVTVNPLPRNDAGSAASICTGTGATLGASSTTGHTYSWSPSTALSSSTISNPSANPTTTTTYTLTETITATGCSAANSVVVTVNPLPGNDAGSTATICSGAITTVGSSSTAGHTYSWSPSTTLSSSTMSNPTANPTTTSTYTLTETITATGCSASNSVVVTVNPLPGNDAGSAASICSGASTTLGASSTTGHTYNWSPSTALSSSAVSNPSASPTTTTTYTLTETITATGCSTANSVVTTVNPLPGNDAGSAASICSGTSTTLGASSTTGHTYSWSPSTALSSSTVSNPSASPTTTTTYTLTETITATSCSAANSVVVTVNALPSNDAGSAKTICSGTNTTIGASSTTGHTYSWSPSTALSSSTISNPTANPTTTTTYTLTETITATGCSAANSVVVTVNPLPSNDAGSAASICTGTSAAIGASSTTGHTYSWSPSTALSSSTVSNPSANPTTTTTYTLTETITATGCSVANAVTVTVNPIPGNDAGTSTTICNGSNTTLGAASTSGHTYSWSPSATLSSSTVSNPTASPTTATTYTLTETITATGCSVANTVAIAVNIESGNPTSATASSTSICSGSSTTLTLNGGGGGSSETIRWYTVSCGGTLAGTGNNLSVSPTTTTIYYGRYEDAAPCSYNSTCASVTITVNTESGTPSSATASSTTICSGQSTTLTLNGGGGGTGEVIRWYSGACGETLVGTGNNLSVSPTTTTTYYGRYEDALPCNYNSACMAVTITVNPVPGNDAGASQTICNGVSTTIGANSTTGHAYSWSPSTGLSTSTASKPTATPTTTTTYTLTETITATGCSIANNVSVTVNPVPGNDAGTNETICTGGSATIGAASTTGNTYSWSPSTALSSSTVSNPSANPTTTTTYTLTETITATGCSASNSVSVTVNAGPGDNAGSNKSVCSGSGVTIGAASTAGHTYSWSPSGTLSSSTVSNPTATPSSTSTYTLTETITATGCTVSNPVTVTVNPIPGNDAGSNETVCSGTAVTIGASGTTGHTYSWSPSTALSSSTVSNPSASPTVNTTYTLTETITATGCTAANTVAVGVSTSPGNNAGSNQSICNGNSTTLGAANTTGHTYSWSPSATLSSSTVSNPTANPTTTSTYTLTEAITASGCTASNAVVVTVNPIPGNDAGASSTSICSGSSTTLGATSTTGHTYSWSPSTGLSSSTNSKPTANPTASTTYTLTETITATGCSAANTAVVLVSTTLSITEQPANETICSGSGSSVSFTTSSSSSSATYQWWQLKTGLLQSWAGLTNGTNSNGATISGSATNALTISDAPSAMSGWSYYCVESNACNSVTSNTVTLTVAGSAGTWIGNVSTDWNNAGNWCGSVPTSTTNVTIPSGTTYSPIISGTGTAYCNNLTINSGAILTIETNGILNLYGNPTISGTYNHTGGKLVLTGASAQTIPTMTVDTVIMDNSNGATLSGNLTVNGLLTLTSGIINTGSNEVSVNNAATTSVTGYSSSSYIVGNLLRNVNSSGSYDYPLGTTSYYEFFNITLSGTSGFTNIVGTFTNANPLASLLGGLLNLGTILVGGTEITDLLDYGYWTLTPNSTMTAGSYTVEGHEQGQSNSGPTPDSYALLKRHDASDSWAALGTHSNSTQSVTNGIVKAVCSNLTSFSDYSIGYGGGVLPIKLEQFTAQLYNNNQDALLEWITASEENNDYFEVEVATDNNTANGELSFQGIGRVEGNGTSFIQHNYSFIDTTSNKSGTRYYRLKQVNFDSTFTYSDIDPLTFASNSNNTVRLSALYPNPCISTLHFELSSPDDEGIDIYVNGMSGQEVFKERLQIGTGNNNFSFDVSELAHALYLFNVANDNNSVSIHDKFEKQ